MADIKQALTEEIRRLAKKEVKSACEPLAAKIAELKKLVSAQSKELKALIGGATKAPKAPKLESLESADGDKSIRLNAKGIRRIREKLDISQMVMAKLVDASHLSVSHWEIGKTEPRLEFKKKIAALRSMSRNDIVKRCNELNIKLKPARAPKKKLAQDVKETPKEEQK